MFLKFSSAFSLSSSDAYRIITSDNVSDKSCCLLCNDKLSCNVYAKPVTVTSSDTKNSLLIIEFKYNVALHEVSGLVSFCRSSSAQTTYMYKLLIVIGAL